MMAGGPNDQIILFGDSITENSFDVEGSFSYAAALSHEYKRKLDVINRGFSGYNTNHGLTVLPNFMPKTNQAVVKLLIICFGANDSCLPHDPTGHHVSLDNFRNNLISIITSPDVRAHSPGILLLTPPPIDEYQQEAADTAKGFHTLRRTAQNTANYVAVCRDVGSQLKIPVVDIWTAFLQYAGWDGDQEKLLGSRRIPPNEAFQSLFCDGLHLTSLGYRLVYKEVMQSIEYNYPELDTRHMPYKHPPWETAPT